MRWEISGRTTAFSTKKAISTSYLAKTSTGLVNANNLVLLANTPALAESLMYRLVQAAGSIRFYVNQNKTKFMCFKHEAIFTLSSKPLKSLDQFTYLGSNISSTESGVNNVATLLSVLNSPGLFLVFLSIPTVLWSGWSSFFLGFLVPSEFFSGYSAQFRIPITFKNTKVKVRSPNGETDYFDIVAGVLQGETLAPYLFIIYLNYVLRTSIDKMKDNGFKLAKERSRRYSTQTTTLMT